MSEDKNFYVYGYIRLDNNSYFYIGKGRKNRAERLDNRKQHFMNIINKTNCCYEILFDNLTEEDAFLLEQETIEDLVLNEGYSIEIPNYKCEKNKECHLVNLTWGGDGTTGYSIKQSEQTIKNRVIKNTGLKRNEAQKYRISTGIKKYIKENPNHIQNIVNKRKQSNKPWHNEGTKKKIGIANRGKIKSKESIERMLNTFNLKSKEEIDKINKARSESVKKTKREKSRLFIQILDINKNVINTFTTVTECAEWLIKENLAQTFNGARWTINNIANLDKLYKNKIYITKSIITCND